MFGWCLVSCFNWVFGTVYVRDLAKCLGFGMSKRMVEWIGV